MPLTIDETNYYMNSTDGCYTCKVNPDITLYETSKTSKSSTSKVVANKTKTLSDKASYLFDKGRTDKRVSLNVAPLINGAAPKDDRTFASRVTYVLGQKQLTSNKTIHGFLYGCLNKSCGLIFPYTPSVSINHSVSYETNDIIHSNLQSVSYKNTPPPTISISGVFTADTRNNALHMLSAIWFLRAVTKCDFGEHDENDGINVPGMPPPTLYLNGYNEVMDNIPVVVESFSYTLPEDKDYVQLSINLNCESNKFIYSKTNENNLEETNSLLNGIKVALNKVRSSTTDIQTNGDPNGKYYFTNWLPTELKVNVSLKVVPNLIKYKKQFDLNKYKMGIYNIANKGGSLFIPYSDGSVNLNCTDYRTITKMVKDELQPEYNALNTTKAIEAISSGNITAGLNTLFASENTTPVTSYYSVADEISKIGQKEQKEQVTDAREYLLDVKVNQRVNDTLSSLQGSLKGRTYYFDKSGWTW